MTNPSATKRNPNAQLTDAIVAATARDIATKSPAALCELAAPAYGTPLYHAYWTRLDQQRALVAAMDYLSSAQSRVCSRDDSAKHCFYGYLLAKHESGREISDRDWTARKALEDATDARGRLDARDALERCLF